MKQKLSWIMPGGYDIAGEKKERGRFKGKGQNLMEEVRGGGPAYAQHGGV